jgi:hypothetical protein
MKYLILILILITFNANSSTHRQCVILLNCSEAQLGELSSDELNYLELSLEISAKKKVTLSDLKQLNKRTLDVILKEDQISDIPIHEIAEYISLPIDVADMMIKINLHRLYYNFDNSLLINEQIKNYQRDHNFPDDGNLTYKQFTLLAGLAEINEPSELYILGSKISSSSSDGDLIEIDGTWDILGEEEAFPINKSKLICSKKSMVCSDEYQRFVTHEVKFNKKLPISSYYTDSGTDYYSIISWDEEEIIAKLNADNACRSVVLTLNYKTDEVQQITTNKEQDCPLDFPRLESARVTRLVESFGFQYDYWRRLKRSVSCLKSSAFTKYKNEMAKSLSGNVNPCE